MPPRLLLDELFYESDDYEWLKTRIDTHGFFRVDVDGVEIRFNNPSIATIFASSQVEVYDLDTGQTQSIDLPAYRSAYIEGYQSGLQYFDQEYHLPPTLLYGPNGASYIESLYQLCFVITTDHYHFFQGWNDSSRRPQSLINLNLMEQYGKYAALVWRVQELTNKHPALFETWEQRGNTPRPPVIDQIETNGIYILPDARSALINDLKTCVDPLQHESLEILINGGTQLGQPIVWQCKQAKLGKIFHQRVESKTKNERQISADKTIIAKWICRHFERIEKGVVKKFSESTILNALSNKGLAKS